MHIADGILSPAVCAGCGVLSLGAVAYSTHRMQADLSSRAVPLTGMTAALIFAAQMVNFPLFVVPVSGHLLGGVLAGVLLGPWAGCIAMTLVLVVQALLFADGGLLALGANILNMGVIGAWGGSAIYETLRRWMGSSSRAVVVSSAVASALSVLAAACAFCAEFALSLRGEAFSLQRTVGLMVAFHALIAIGEAVITGSLVGFLVQRRPELLQVAARSVPTAARLRTTVWAGLTCALAVAAGLSPFASELSDGLDAVAERVGFEDIRRSHPVVFSEYELPELHWSSPWAVSFGGILGTSVVFLLGWGVIKLVDRAPRTELPIDRAS